MTERVEARCHLPTYEPRRSGRRREPPSPPFPHVPHAPVAARTTCEGRGQIALEAPSPPTVIPSLTLAFGAHEGARYLPPYWARVEMSEVVMGPSRALVVGGVVVSIVGMGANPAGAQGRPSIGRLPSHSIRLPRASRRPDVKRDDPRKQLRASVRSSVGYAPSSSSGQVENEMPGGIGSGCRARWQARPTGPR